MTPEEPDTDVPAWRRATAWLIGGISVFALSLVVVFADQLRCSGGDCARE